MRFLIPKGKTSPNTSYYTYSDLNSDNIEVWFDRCDRDWVLPIKEVFIQLRNCETGEIINHPLKVKRPNPDNPISKEFTKEEFNNVFSTGKKYPEEMVSWKDIIYGKT